ncbi:MAG: hypothetical protein NVS4B12_18550 [Ktedonobacteraceae bacterium]
MPLSLKQEQLRQLLNEQHVSLQCTFPSARQSALLALIRASNWYYFEMQYKSTGDPLWSPVGGFYTPGLQKALSLCLSTQNTQTRVSDEALDQWANSTLQACSHLAEAGRILDYCDTGFMRMQQGNDADYNVWIASKKMPTEWREREDIAEWTHFLEQTYAAEMYALSGERTHIQQQLAVFMGQWNGQSIYQTIPTIDSYYHRLGTLHIKSLTPYNTYPASATIGGCTFTVYREVLGVLLGLALKQLDVCQIKLNHHPAPLLRHSLTQPLDDTSLIEALTTTLALHPAAVRLALDAYTLDASNISYHSSVSAVPIPPLIRLDEQHRVASFVGLLTDPLFFLTRELKRRYSYEYHTASQLREEIFRQDVYALFADRRFVKSTGRVELRGTKGTLTTDVDALIFDRKTGALALFELKSQDPFAYSHQERLRQRDYFYRASKQVTTLSEWVKRNGANTLLSRLDPAQVKRIKAQNVYIFVLGRYLAHFFDGPPFNSRAAWGTWSQVLRFVNGKAFDTDDANSIQSLFNNLSKNTPLALTDKATPNVQEIEIGNRHIHVYSSFEAYKSSFLK